MTVTSTDGAGARVVAGDEDGGLLPVRSVNAHRFCPRLFWFEEVEGVFVDNEHTIEGQHVHRRVDRPGGSLAAPEGPEGPPWHARSLWLSDAALGVSGKLDLVEEDATSSGVFPVDTKKGRSMDGALWPADEVQLTLQALLLRSAGYRVDSIAAWYAEERRRVRVELTDELVAAAVAEVSAANATRAGAHAPAPLDGSSKCLGCSLNVVCLPDETRRLSLVDALEAEVADQAAVRRVVPPRADRMPVYVQSTGATLRKSGAELLVVPRGEDEPEHRVGLDRVAQVNVYGMVNVTTPLLQECLDRSIPLCFFSSGGWYRGRTASSGNRQVAVRLAQYRAMEGLAGLEVARALVADKIANGRTLLRRNMARGDEADGPGGDDGVLKELRRHARQAVEAESTASLLGYEGAAARLYWGAYSELLARDDEAFRMSGRNRRPPRDRANALLSFGYGMLAKDAELAVSGVGLDAWLGVYHTAHHGRPSMALDLMEPFRPLVVDSVVLQMVRRREVTADDFIVAGQQVSMKPHARKAVIRAFERRMDELVTHPVFGYAITYRQVLWVQARLLARYLMGELETVPTFRTR